MSYVPPEIVGDVLSDAQLWAGARNVGESNRPREGYPGLIPGYPGTRLFMDAEDVLAATTHEEVYPLSDGTITKIHRVYLRPGHDTESPSRKEFLTDPSNVDNLLHPPVPDIVTGSDQMVDPERFQQWLDSGFRVFDQHNRVLPGSYERVMQLLGLRSQGRHGRQLGMPVGNGTFASPGVHPASDPFILTELPGIEHELATLVWGHARNEQSYEVWVPPGGFGSREDVVDGVYSSWQAAVRLCLRKTAFDISDFEHLLVHREIALSSPSTINSVLIPESHLVKVPYSHELVPEVAHEIPTGNDVEGPRWLSLKSLITLNTKLRREGVRPDFDHESQPDHIYWDTHMRGLIAAVSAFRNSSH